VGEGRNGKFVSEKEGEAEAAGGRGVEGDEERERGDRE